MLLTVNPFKKKSGGGGGPGTITSSGNNLSYTTMIERKSDGAIMSTGYNVHGQLFLANGNTDTSIGTISQSSLSASDISQIAKGPTHTMILKSNGEVWGVGSNTNGQLGTGDTSLKRVLTKINISDVAQIVCGDKYTMFLKNDGTAWACGINDFGQLGTNGATPTIISKVLNVTDVKKIYCGGTFTYFLKNDGTLWGCGQRHIRTIW